jgi:hypothetical protein
MQGLTRVPTPSGTVGLLKTINDIQSQPPSAPVITPETKLPSTGVPPLSPELESQISGTPTPQLIGKPLHPPIVPSTIPPVGDVPSKQGPFGQMPLKPPPVLRTVQHRKFFESLQTLSNESPIILAGYIAKYAKAIEKTDPVVALKLFNVVKSIRG